MNAHSRNITRDGLIAALSVGRPATQPERTNAIVNDETGDTAYAEVEAALIDAASSRSMSAGRTM